MLENKTFTGLVGAQINQQVGASAREPELSRVCNQLRISVEALEFGLLELKTRLEGVLSGECIQGNEGVSIPEFSTTLGKEISLSVGRINGAVEDIRNLKVRLEV